MVGSQLVLEQTVSTKASFCTSKFASELADCNSNEPEPVSVQVILSCDRVMGAGNTSTR